MRSCVAPLPLYHPRNPRASSLWRLADRHFTAFQQVYDERFQAKYGFWRPIVERSVTAFLKCGDLHEGFARVRCADCEHEMFVAFSCKQRCACPSCHQKRALLTALHVAQDVCAAVPHRQVVFTIPKRLGRVACPVAIEAAEEATNSGARVNAGTICGV
jgi:ribosomal protein S27E